MDKNKVLVEKISALRFENTFNGKIVSSMREEKKDVGDAKNSQKSKINLVLAKKLDYFENIIQNKYTYNKTKLKFVGKLRDLKSQSQEYTKYFLNKPKLANFFTTEDQTPTDVVDFKPLLKHRIKKLTANNKERYSIVNKYYVTMEGIKNCFEYLQKIFVMDDHKEVSSTLVKAEDQN